jgi:thiol-disulfide isomerase/thioredoxin
MFFVLIAIAAAQVTQAAPSASPIRGTFSDVLIGGDGIAVFELRPSPDRDLPRVGPGDRVFKANLPQFRPPGAPNGLLVAYVEGERGATLFIDTNLDGRLAESEGRPYAAGADRADAREIRVDLVTGVQGAPALPFRCRVVASPHPWIHFTAAFRAEGVAEIGGQRTVVRVPYNPSRNTVDIRRGMIQIGDVSTFLDNEQPIFRVRDRYVSLDSADFAARTFVLKEHPPEAYRLIDYAPGSRVPDFEFTDLNGLSRKLSDFKGRYVLLDFWGTWCAPCVRDFPVLKALRDRFRDRGFEILGMDFEHSRPAAGVKVFLEGKGVDWPIAAPESVKDLIQNRFRIHGYPTLVLLDPDGVVVAVHGEAREMVSVVEKAMEKRRP